MKTIALIPARTGSQGIPNKNFRLLAGTSPVDRAIACCRAAGISTMVSSDQRPRDATWIHAPHVHQDTSSMVDVVLNALHYINATHLLCVQPTQPLRQPKHLKHAMRLLKTHLAVASVVQTEPVAKQFFMGDGRALGADWAERRQDAEPTYSYDGTVYGFSIDWFKQYRTFDPTRYYLFEILKSETCRLDDMEDWKIAERGLR